MNPDLLNLLKIGAFCIGAPVLVAFAIRRQSREHRKLFLILGGLTVVVCTIGFLLRGNATLNAIALPSSDAGGTALALALLGLAVGIGLVLYGPRRCLQLVRDLIAAIGIAIEERRNPVLRDRNESVRKYERAVSQLSTPVADRPERLRRSRLSSVLIFRDFTDAQIGYVAEHLNAMFFAGGADNRMLVAFLEEERAIAAIQPLLVCGHLVRLNQLAHRVAVPIVVSATSA